MVLGFSSTGFCNVFGGPSEIQPRWPPEPQDWWLGGSEQGSPERNEEARHLVVFGFSFQLALTLRMAEPWLDSLEGWTNSPRTATG